MAMSMLVLIGRINKQTNVATPLSGLALNSLCPTDLQEVRVRVESGSASHSESRTCASQAAVSAPLPRAATSHSLRVRKESRDSSWHTTALGEHAAWDCPGEAAMLVSS